MKNQLFSRWNRGLMPAVFLAPFVLAVAVFVGCNRESPVSAENQAEVERQDGQFEKRSDVNVQTLSLETAKYSYKGALLEKDEFQKQVKSAEPMIMVAGAGVLEQNVVFAFNTKAELLAWAKTKPFADKLVRLSLAEAVTQPGNDGEVVVDRKAVVAVARTILYQNPGFTTTDRGPITTTYPNSRSSLGSFNDRASSLKTSNSTGYLAILGFYEDVNFRGRTLFIFLSPGLGLNLSDLHVFNFNDNISSVRIGLQ